MWLPRDEYSRDLSTAGICLIASTRHIDGSLLQSPKLKPTLSAIGIAALQYNITTTDFPGYQRRDYTGSGTAALVL